MVLFKPNSDRKYDTKVKTRHRNIANSIALVRGDPGTRLGCFLFDRF